AQTDSSVESLVRDQRAAQTRLRGLREKMERLTQKLDREGRTYAAGLLRNAITELDRTKVESHMDEVATKMQETGELHKSLALQNQILSDIENLLQVLQDKKSLDKIDQMLEQMKNTLEGIDSLKKEQESLLNETRDTDKSRTGSDPSKSANPKM